MGSAQAIDTAALRRSIYSKEKADRADLSQLIALGAEAGDDPSYLTLVADVGRDALDLDVDPRGYVSDADAQWLIAQLGDGGGLTCRAEFETLKAVIGHAVNVPPSLSAFAVGEVKRAILSGHRGPAGADHAAGVVTSADVEALRLFVFAPNAGAALHVDRATAEALFDIAHATAGAANAAEFADFFARAVGNYLIGAVFLTPDSREEELRLERELDKPAPGLGEFLSQMAHIPTVSNILDALRSDRSEAADIVREENAETDDRLDAAASVDADEGQWIVAHLTRPGDLTSAEKRLLAFLRDEAASAPPEITALYAKAG
jgi:hypothetical protein